MTTRQSELFAGQDWTVLYRIFSSVNFNASDPATINKALRDYVRNTYPEDFNDWLESSEFVAIIDLLSWLAGTLAYKTDLAARENFLDTAEARDSIIRLARFLSYNPSRNRPARGILKITSIRTDEDVSDSFGNSLANQTIIWNDPDDVDWLEKFISVLNAALISTNPFGTPLKTDTLTSASSALYRLNNVLSQANLSFSSNVAGRSMDFSVVNTDFSDGALLERTPNPAAALHLMYLQDGGGNGSARTGFFFFFKQGTAQRETFNIGTPIENQTLDLAPANVTQDDVWVQTVDDSGTVLTDWTKVPAIFSENITYNSVALTDHNIFSVLSKDEDRATIRFSDGRFGNAPVGLVRVTYRTANGLFYTIRPTEISQVSILVPYISRTGATRNLTITLALQESVSNSSARETEEDIRRRAPLVYATQNRMVSGEDYNTFPLQSNLALKVKALNRVYSGHSRFNALHDPTSTYSDVSVYGDDGSFFMEKRNAYVEVPTTLNRTPRQMLDIHLQPMVENADVVRQMQDWLLRSRPTSPNGIMWQRTTNEYGTQSATGRFNADSVLLRPGVAVLFDTPAGAPPRWAGMVEQRGPINTAFIPGVVGNVTLSEPIPGGATIRRVQPGYHSNIPASLALGEAGLDRLFATFTSFDLFYDYAVESDATAQLPGAYSVGHWRVARSNTGYTPTATERLVVAARYLPGDPGIWRLYADGLRYSFESQHTVEWYNSGKIAFDSETGTRKVDTVRVLRFNDDYGTPPPHRAMTREWDLSLGALYAYGNGSQEPRRITFDLPDSDEDGVVDEPDTLERLMPPAEISLLFWQRDASTMVETARADILVTTGTLPTGTAGNVCCQFADGVLAALPEIDALTTWPTQFFTYASGSWNAVTPLAATQFVVRLGRGANIAASWTDASGATTIPEVSHPVSFLWKHYAPSDHRIDPSLTNVHDMFVLTTEYDTAMRDWVSNGADPALMPTPPTELDLRLAFSDLESYRMFSDQLVWRPVKYRLLFGPGADPEMRAQIKIVKLANASLSDGEIRSRVVRTVNDYFIASRWDFGETFFYTELAAYLHQQLAGVIGSAVLVPVGNPNGVFGDGFEVTARSDEMFLSSLQVGDVVIITSNTDSALRIRR